MENQSVRSKTEENWNQFFSRLAHAEQAAAEQCQVISKMFSERGQLALAKQYDEFAKDEAAHFALVSKICKPLQSSPTAAVRVYSGSLMNKTTNPLERMASVHLVFEPSALAFLGFFHQNAKALMQDKSWADDIKQSFREILQDEVGHVSTGASLVKSMLKLATPEEISITKRAMRKTRTFIIAGIKEMFKDTPNADTFVKPMLARFKAQSERATEEAFT
jgi:uncharacterized ferritin-like protein (DUF455 family)